MCGIVGQVRAGGRPVSRELLGRMCRALEHRGPDSRGLHVEGPAGLGIQRLRVIDLATGDQPIYNEDRSVVVVLNGEIYNYRELRERLRRAGHVFATQGDTEAIVHLYEEHGVDCVRHLHGMFAFSLWDRRRRRLLIARDRLGKKPLFYALRHGALSWASELAALLEDPEIPRDVDHLAVDRYLAYHWIPTPRTAFRAVRQLPPAHVLTWEQGTVDVRRYWRLDYGRKLDVRRPEELHEPIRAAVREATRRRMVADVPLGAFLSGGIDSSAVVAAMAEASPEPIRTFSIGFEHERFDELPHARLIAERFGTEHRELVVRPDSVALLPRIVRHYGQPFADPSAIPCFHLAEMTRAHVTVALSGDGGDEAFGGYTRYVANRLAARLDLLPARLRALLGAAGARLARDGEVSSPRNRARRLLTGLALDPPARYARYQAFLERERQLELYTDDLRALVTEADPLDVIAEPWGAASGTDPVDVMLEVDTLTYLPDDLLTKMDIATMAHGLEARSPLLDHQILELAAAIPADLKVHGREKKWIFREALRGWLPDGLLDRPKQGFSVPVSDWFRGELRDHLRDVLLDPATLARGWFREQGVRDLLARHEAGGENEGRQLWALLMLELWHRELADRPAAAALAA
jgi:asparagine synthase (glutamine-hydrolysing)